MKLGQNNIIHPGEILDEEFLKPMGISKYKLAKYTGMQQARVGQIVAGKREITNDTALRLGEFFSMSPEFWLNLQTRYNMDMLQEAYRTKKKTRPIVTPYTEIQKA